MKKCELCPRRCGVDRSAGRGECGADDNIRIAAIINHFGEEPVISSGRGSGAVFFSGCPLSCVFCQNAPISSGGKGEIYRPPRLKRELTALANRAENINLVTAGHYLPQLLPILQSVRPSLNVPIVYNSGGYETAAAVRALKGVADVYLPDFKYVTPSLAEAYSGRADYPGVARAAIDEMTRQQPLVVIKEGLIKRGVIIRHLVLPGCRKESLAVVREIAERWGDRALVSIMSQYTPRFNRSSFSELNRRVTSFEYESVVDEAVKLGLKGFTQLRQSATDELTPDF